MLSTSHLACAGVLVTLGAHAIATGDLIRVPGSANPWLVDAPAGTSYSFGGETDTSPGPEPVVEAMGGAIPPTLTFAVGGTVSNGPAHERVGGDGRTALFAHSHEFGDINGLSNISAPLASLVGVFLTDEPATDAPISLDFSTPSARNFQQLHPALGQTFFIGDGQTDAGITQLFEAPDGATRLVLGVMDRYGWTNNPGEFDVTIRTVPAPGVGALLLLACAGFGARRSRKL